MISVIIPTMWKANEINIMLPHLNDHPLIGEIILIDNEPSQKNETTCSLSKVNYVTFEKNIFPTPSWNYGYKNAKFDKLFIINDDVLFSIAIVDAIYDAINDQNGIITIDQKSVRQPLLSLNDKHEWISKITPEKIKLEPCGKLKHKAAIMIGIHRNSYELIPEELLIHFNDYFLFKICEMKKKQNLTILGAEAHTEMSKTVKDFSQIIKHERRIYPGIFKKYNIKNMSC